MPFTERFLAELDVVADPAALVAQPFVVGWRRGDLDRDALRAFAVQFHHQLHAFPRCVSSVHANAECLRTRRVLLSVLEGLEGREPAISDLWLQTCAALGLDRETVRVAPAAPATEACSNDYLYLSQSSTLAGLATLYAFARPLPALCRELRDGLVEHYGMTGGPGLDFFDTAGYELCRMADTLREELGRVIGSDEDARTAIHGAEAATTALRGLLAGAASAAPALVPAG